MKTLRFSGIFSSALLLGFILIKCKSPANLNTGIVVPTPSDNPQTEAKIALGKKLFFDKRLSLDGTVACATCHVPSKAFTDQLPLSLGIDGQHTERNAPGILNMAWHKELHWDGGIDHLEVQPLAPLTAPNEMGETVENVIKNSKNIYVIFVIFD